MKKLSDYQKIMQVIEAKGISPNQAEINIGVKAGVISKLPTRRDGFGRMHPDNTDKFIRIFKVNRKWWESGEGEMFLDGAEESASEMKINRSTSPDIHEILLESIKGINKLIDTNNQFIDDKKKEVARLDKDKNWAYSQIEKLHAKLGIPNEAQ